MIWLTWRQLRVQAVDRRRGRRRDGGRARRHRPTPGRARDGRCRRRLRQADEHRRQPLLGRVDRRRRGPGPRRRLLGRADGGPRARGGHPPAGLEPERHPHPLARHEARRHHAGGRARRRSPDPRGDLVVAPPRRRGEPRPRRPARAADAGVVRDARAWCRSPTRSSRSSSASPWVPSCGGPCRPWRSPSRSTSRSRSPCRCGCARTSWPRPPRPSRSVRRPSTGSVPTTGAHPESITVHTAQRGDWVLTNETLGADGRPAALPAWLSDCFAAAPDRVQRPGRGLAHRPVPRAAGERGLHAAGGLPAGRQLLAAPAGRRRRCTSRPRRCWPGFCVWWARARLS